MVVSKILVTLFFIISTAIAAENELMSAWKAKNYRKVSDLYRDNPRQDYSRKELVLISYSLRKLRFFRQDIKLNMALVKKEYAKNHNYLLNAIKRGDTIDPDAYPVALKILYWNLFTSYGEIIKGYEHDSKRVEKDHKYFVIFSKILSDLEFREGKADKINDAIIAHRQYLTDKIYRFKTSWLVQYVSWQQDATIKHTTQGNAGLIVTNRGVCLGGDMGIENYRYHFYIDGCFLYGSGGVNNIDQNLIDNYQQSNVPALGFKAGPGASLIVSSSRSRIGIKLPVIYSVQDLTTPQGSDYKIDQGTPISLLASMYSRWQFNKLYFQTEFGKYLQQEQTFWGFGVGKEF